MNTGLPTTGTTWGHFVWPVWLFGALSIFLAFEIFALVTNPANTLSAWVWESLGIHRNESIGAWTALDFLVFGIWLTLLVWLTFHFFFGRFT